MSGLILHRGRHASISSHDLGSRNWTQKVSPIMPPADFDPLVGTFTVAHRRLRQRLVGSDDWDHFNGTSTSHVILGGFGLVEDNVINLPGDSYRAIGLRSFDPTTGRWAIRWLDGRCPHRLDVPVTGAFDEHGVGVFEADDEHEGQPVVVRFTWSGITATAARWEQAFSPDNGKTWETNWIMELSR
jgi:hypothetical protein